MQRNRRWLSIAIFVLLVVPTSRAEEEAGSTIEMVPPQVVVHIDMRLLEMPPRRVAGYLGGMRGARRPVIRPMALEEARALLADARHRPDVQQRNWSRATTHFGATVILDDTRSETYLQDYDVEVGNSGRSVADPIIGTLVEGVALEARARLRKDDMTLHLKGAWGSVLRPIPVFTAGIGADDDRQEVTIQLPELRFPQVDEEIAFRGEGWWLVATRVQHGDARGGRTARVALVHARRVLYSPPQLGTVPEER